MWPLARPAAVFPLSPFSNSSRVHSSRGSSDYSVKASGMEAAGLDTEGRQFRSPDEMWVEYTGDDTKKHQWYREGVSYWEGVEASVDGVLGGYGHVNDADVKDSEAFIKNLFSELFVDGGRNRHLVALDCGSGFGRITKNLLLKYFNEVDLLEPVSHFLDAARESLSGEAVVAGSDTHKASNFFCVPLQDFTPQEARYDVIWVQWCIGHLTDNDFVSFFSRAKAGLKPGGCFVIKENIAQTGNRISSSILFCPHSLLCFYVSCS
ncbi:Alpha N-terminal protein methyltransferase 1 [Linum perenne]